MWQYLQENGELKVSTWKIQQKITANSQRQVTRQVKHSQQDLKQNVKKQLIPFGDNMHACVVQIIKLSALGSWFWSKEAAQAVNFDGQLWVILIDWYTVLDVTKLCKPWTATDEEFKGNFPDFPPHSSWSYLQLDIPVFSHHCSGCTPFQEPAKDFIDTIKTLWVNDIISPFPCLWSSSLGIIFLSK